MGAFASKLSEAAEKVQSENDVEENKRDGDSKKRIDVVTVKTNSHGGGIEPPPLPVAIACFAYFIVGVTLRRASYVLVQRDLEKSEERIKELEAKIQGEGSQDLYLEVKLKRWKKKRDNDEAYLKRHKLVGKLVKIFPPNTETHIN